MANAHRPARRCTLCNGYLYVRTGICPKCDR